MIKKYTLQTLKWLCIAIVTILVVFLLTLALALFTHFGRSTVLHVGTDIVNNKTPWQLDKSQLSMPALGNIKLNNFELKYKSKTVIFIKKAQLKWQPSALLKKNINVKAIQANTLVLNLHHLPSSKDEDNTVKPSDAPFELPQLNALKEALPDISIKNIDIAYFSVNKASPEIDNQLTVERTPAPVFTQYYYDLTGHVFVKKNQPIQSQLVIINTPRNNNANNQPLFFKNTINLKATQIDTNTVSLLLKINESEQGFLARTLKIKTENDTVTSCIETNVTINKTLVIDVVSLVLPIGNNTLTASGIIKTNAVSKVKLEDITFNFGEKDHRLNGEITKNTIDINATLNQLNLLIAKPWLPDLNNGRVSLNANIQGEWQSLNINTQVSAAASYLNLPVSLNADISGTSQNLLIKTLNIKNNNALLSVDGSLSLKNKKFDTQFLIQDIALKPYKAILKKQLQKQAIDTAIIDDLFVNIERAKGKIKGEFDKPDIDIASVVNGEFKRQPFELSLDTQANKSQVLIKKARLVLDDASIKMTGSANIDKQTLDTSIAINKVPLSLARLADIDLPPNLAANLSVNSDVSGRFSSPIIEGDVRLDGVFEDIPFIYEQDINVVNKKLTIEKALLTLFSQEVLDLALQIDEKNIDAQLNVTNLPTQLVNMLPITLNKGDLSASIKINGPLILPSINGEIQYDSFIVTSDDNQADVQTPYSLSALLKTDTENEFFLNIKANTDNADPAILTVKTPLNPVISYLNSDNKNTGLPLDTNINGVFNLQTAQLFLGSNVHDFSGLINLNAQLTGNINQPNMQGKIVLNKAKYAHAIHGTDLDKINCTVNLDLTQAKISDCYAIDADDGKLVVDGKVIYPNKNTNPAGDVRLSLNLDSMQLVNRQEITSQTSGEINVIGDMDIIDVKGSLDITPLSASIESAPPVSIPSIKVIEVADFNDASDQNAPKAPLKPEINLDIDINARNQAFLRGRGLDAELKGNINVYGTAQSPQYDGEFTIAKGHIELFNKKFDLTGGKVTLATQAIGLNIVGTYTEDSQKVNVILSGRADDIAINFSAEPTLPEDEILAFIIFGKKIAEISSLEALQLASAVRQLQGGGGFDLIASTRDTLGVDNLSFESTDEGLNIGVGKYINERVYLEVQKTPDPSQPWQGNITIDLLPNLKLESSTGGNSGVQGATLKWKNDY